MKLSAILDRTTLLIASSLGLIAAAWTVVALTVLNRHWSQSSFVIALLLDAIALVPAYRLPAKKDWRGLDVLGFFLVWMPTIVLHGLGLMLAFVPAMEF